MNLSRVFALGVSAVTALVALSVAPAPVLAQDQPDEGCNRDVRVPRSARYNGRTYTYYVNNATLPTSSSGATTERLRRRIRARVVDAHESWEDTKTDCRSRNGRPLRDQSNFDFTYGGFTAQRYGSSKDINGNGSIDDDERGYDQTNTIDYGPAGSCGGPADACAAPIIRPVDHDSDPKTPNVARRVDVDIRVEEGITFWYRPGRLVDSRFCHPRQPSRRSTCGDFMPLLTHEVGHTLGLEHTCNGGEAQRRCSDANRSQTMNGVVYTQHRDYSEDGRTVRFLRFPNSRTLGFGDIFSYRVLY